MPKKSFLAECQCSGRHYVQVDNWPGDKDVLLAFIDRPTTFWQIIKTWWKHKEGWISEVVLTPQQKDQLIKFLQESDIPEEIEVKSS